MIISKNDKVMVKSQLMEMERLVFPLKATPIQVAATTTEVPDFLLRTN